MNYRTEQEDFWAGEFGTEYIKRNSYENFFQKKMYLWKRMLEKVSSVTSCIEFGSNIGLNLMVLQNLFPGMEGSAVEINPNACKQLRNIVPPVTVWEDSILNFKPEKTYDLSFTAGVLIHINPDELKKVYANLYHSSQKYIIINEYYSLNPVEINYRGYTSRLFKRDFASEFMDLYPDCRLVDYGFFYHRDPNCSEDSNYFVFEKEE